MKLKTVLCDKPCSATCFQKHPLLHFAAAVILAAQVIPNIALAQAEPAPPLSGVLGKVQTLSGSSLDVAGCARRNHSQQNDKRLRLHPSRFALPHDERHGTEGRQ